MSVATQRTKRRQQREETRLQILQAAREFLSEHTFRELSVDALMSRTGHTRTVFYRHFDDIPALILALIEEDGGELVAMAQDWAQTDRVGHDVARQRLAAFVDFHARNGSLIQAIAEAAHHDEAVERAYSTMVEGFIAITAQAIEVRVASGELGPLDAPEIARALIHMLNGYLQDTFARGVGEVDRERALEAVWTIWTRTLFPPR
jgi:AcrR family transcriptional regulator